LNKLTTMSYELAENGIAIVTIDVKDRPMNILTPELHQDVGTVAEQLAKDDKAIGAIIQSGKPAFVAGGDLKRIVGLYDLNRSPEQAYSQSRVFTEALRKLETCGKPVVCAINGAALGGGLELALACHYRVVIDDPKIPLGLPETSVGLIPGAGGTQRLPRLIGIKQAAELILSGSHVSPQAALKLGMVDQLVNKEDLLNEASRWILEEGKSEQPWDKRGFQIPGGATLNNPKIAKVYQDFSTRVAVETRYNYPAPIAALESIFNGTTVSSFDAALKIETREFSKLTRGAVARNMMRTLFLNKGITDRLNKRPAGIDKFKTSQLAILGHSIESNSTGYACALADIEVFPVSGASDDNNQKILKYAEESLEQRINSGKTSKEKAESILAKIKTSSDDKLLSEIDVIMIVSKIDSKVLSEQIAKIGDSTIIAVDTTLMSLADVNAGLSNPGRVVGWHVNHPAAYSQAAEIVVQDNTSEETLARILDFTQQLRKTPVIQKESSVLFSQACMFVYLEEGLQMLSEGISPALIENAARDAGMQKAPLELIDEISLPLAYQSMNDKSAGAEIVKSMIEEHGRTGIEEGSGFYNYTGGSKSIWQDLGKQSKSKETGIDVEELKQRFLSIQSLRALSFCEDGLIDVIEADIASILICGFPSYTGGMLSYIDTLGIKGFIKQCEQLAEKFGTQYKVSDELYEKAKSSDRLYPIAA
jgi:3-hydroxyacyl-CoA dehydrogenase / enoyl-CoA hydratase / 3-hydroxybutyryl-CoA epimerase